jgi:hypothetical protein
VVPPVLREFLHRAAWLAGLIGIALAISAVLVLLGIILGHR